MSLFRTDQQVALNELLVASQVTADHLQESAEFLDAPEVSAELAQLAGLRRSFVERIEEVIRATGDLPSAADTDRETSESLLQRLRAAFSTNEAESVIQQRLQAEQDLAQLTIDARGQGLAGRYEALLYELDGNIQMIRHRLKALLEKQSTTPSD